MRPNYDGLVTFNSTYQALRLETILDTKTIDFDIRPIPRVLSADCGLAIEFFLKDIAVVQAIVKNEKIDFNTFYKKELKQYIEI